MVQLHSLEIWLIRECADTLHVSRSFGNAKRLITHLTKNIHGRSFDDYMTYVYIAYRPGTKYVYILSYTLFLINTELTSHPFFFFGYVGMFDQSLRTCMFFWKFVTLCVYLRNGCMPCLIVIPLSASCSCDARMGGCRTYGLLVPHSPTCDIHSSKDPFLRS
jgi:hypothetical protein